jgi:hypothetical protein
MKRFPFGDRVLLRWLSTDAAEMDASNGRTSVKDGWSMGIGPILNARPSKRQWCFHVLTLACRRDGHCHDEGRCACAQTCSAAAESGESTVDFMDAPKNCFACNPIPDITFRLRSKHSFSSVLPTSLRVAKR